MITKPWISVFQGIPHSYNKCIITANKLGKLVSRKSSSVFQFSPKIEKLINSQIKAEQQAAQDYLAMAVSFLHPTLARPGAGGFFMKMYEEEIEHGQIFLQYQLLRGGIPEIYSLSAPKVNMQLTLLEAFCKGLEMEKSITESIDKVVQAAEAEKDYQCADFLTSVFLAEQMRSINEFAFHVSRISRLKDEHAIYHYDLELQKSHPFKPKSVPPSNHSVHA